jgi:hypothetical protein
MILLQMNMSGVLCYIKKLSVIVLDGDEKTDIREINNTGNSRNLTPAQLKLLQSSDYSTNLLILADYREKNFDTGSPRKSSDLF